MREGEKGEAGGFVSYTLSSTPWAYAKTLLTHQGITGFIATHLNGVTSGHNHKNKSDASPPVRINANTAK